MKTFLSFLTVLLLVSCGPSSDQVVLSQEDYKKLVGDTIKPEYPKFISIDNSKAGYNTVGQVFISIGSDGHEYQLHEESEMADQWTHYGGCKKCQKERDEINHKLDLILQTIDTIKNK
jgi:hypothetical protein